MHRHSLRLSALSLGVALAVAGCEQQPGPTAPTSDVALSAALGSAQTGPRVFVVFDGETDPALVEQLGGRVVYSYHLVPAVAATAPGQVISQLAAHPRVVRVEPDGQVHINDTELDNAWGVKRIGAGIVHDSGNKGAGVKVAVIDSGCDYTHSDLDGNYAGGWDFVNDDGDPMDDNDHGTHVSGTVVAEDNGVGVVGVAPEADLYCLKVLSSSGGGAWSDIIAALQWAVDNGMQVTNNSYSGGTNPGGTVQAAFDNAAAAGMLHVAAAANTGNPKGKGNNVGYPARFGSVIAVAATDKSDKRARFSSTGDAVELSAPGVNINSTLPGDAYSGETWSGTSMASPHVAGVVALAIAAGIADVRTQLQTTADDLGDAGRDPLYGFGLVDAGALAPVAPAPLDITSTSLPDGTANAAYSATLEATGGTPSYSWAVTAGILPAGLSLNMSTGEISGTPTTVETQTFTATVTDDDAGTDSQQLSITVNAPPPLGINTTNLPDGTVDQVYNATLQATGGTPSYSWAVTAGILPAGLSLNMSTGEISGTPTTVETQTFTVKVTDQNVATDSQELSIAIIAAPQGDVVTITKAVHNSRKSELKVEATSSASTGATDTSPVLQITHINGSALATPIEMTYNEKKDKYNVTVPLSAKPVKVTVTSSAGGSAESGVGGK